MKLKIFMLFLFLILLGTVSAGNNTTEIDNPTFHYESNNRTLTALESGDSNISFSDGYKGYCIEWGEHSAEIGDKFYVNHDVDNNIKTFFVYFYDNAQKDVVATQHMIWKFTDNKEFSRFNQTLYNQIIEKSSTTKVPNHGYRIINNTTKMVFDFKTLISQWEEYQNYFAYKIIFESIQNNDSLINNSNDTQQNISNNLSNIQYNESTSIKEIIFNDSSTSEDTKIIINPNHTTGNEIKILFGSLVLLFIAILLLYKI